MRKKAVDKIFYNQAHKRRMIISYLCVILAFLILSVTFVYFNVRNNQKVYVPYKEKSDISYKVYLNDNPFFDKAYAEQEKQYIASLINYISANFSYNIDIDTKDVDYKYSYRIEADVDVKERNSSKSLYNFTEEILPTVEGQTNSQSTLNINETVKIDYNHFNEIVKNFVGTYKLDLVESTLNVKMYIKAIGSCETFAENHSDESVIMLSIPLTTKTMAIDIADDLIATKDNLLLCKHPEPSYICLIIAGAMFLIAVFYVVELGLFISRNKTANDIYNQELKKILNNYHSYIQKITNDLDVTKYEKLHVDTFTDMLEIRDTLQQPILMVENKLKTGVHFMIPSNTNILYIYTLKVTDIKKKLENDEKIKI
jgi:hypothetical protein